MSKQRYKTVRDNDPDLLNEKIGEHEKKGYVVQGGVSISQVTNGKTICNNYAVLMVLQDNPLQDMASIGQQLVTALEGGMSLQNPANGKYLIINVDDKFLVADKKEPIIADNFTEALAALRHDDDNDIPF